MKKVRSFLFSSLYKLRFFDLTSRLGRNRVIILMYHRFSDKNEHFKIQQHAFENQIKFFEKKYNIISMTHYSEILSGRRADCPKNPIIITIDDGYWDNFAFAFPVLKRYSVPATIFLTTDFIAKRSWLWSNKLEYILKSAKDKKFKFTLNGKTNEFDVADFVGWHKAQLKIFDHCSRIGDGKKDELLEELAARLDVEVPSGSVGDFLPLTWDQVREMHQYGIEFGSHTCSHPILSQLTTKRIQNELRESKEFIENELGSKVNLFSYPNGRLQDFTPEVIEILKRLEFSVAVTTVPGHNHMTKQDPFLLKRVSLFDDDHIKITKTLART